MTRKIKYAIGVIVGVFVAVELLLRLVFGLGNPALFEKSPEYGYRFKPSQNIRRFGNRIYFNDKGLRSEEIDKLADVGTIRILCIGDSITYGGVLTSQKKTYPYLLQDMLNETSSKKFEVINASAPSWGIQNEEAYLVVHGLYESNVVVLQVDRGDIFAPKSDPSIVGTSPRHPDKRPLFAIEELIVRYILKREGEGVNEKTAGSENFKANMDSLRKISDIIKDRNATLLVVYVPSLTEVREEEGIKLGSCDLIHAEAVKLGVPFLDLTEVFRKNKNIKLFRDNIHPDSAGNKVIARAVARMVVKALSGDESK